VTEPGTIAVSTLGCRLNQVESQEILALFEQRGFRAAAAHERAQVHVVNTCTVTGRADFSDRQTIRRIARDNPGAVLVVTGCYAQTDAEAVARIPGVDLVVGNPDKHRLADLLGDLGKRRRPEIRVGDVRTSRGVPVAPVTRRGGRSRAFVKIQDGCQHRCAFCIVPAARGGSRSQAPGIVREQVEALVGAGYPEITLTGVDIGHYGRDLAPRTSLAALVLDLAEVRGLRWLRLSSVLPAYWSDELIEAVTGTRAVAPHLHLPLQSGSDRVLRLMRRPYNVRMFRALAERLAGTIPGLGLGTDLIVGHPGEDDGDFRETVRAVEELPLSYLHVFPYSDRKGTEAAARGDRVAPPVIRERSARIRALGRAKNLAFRRGLVGQRREVLVLEERDRETGFLTGLTSNYVEVLFGGPAELARRFARVRVTAAGTDRTFGVLEEADG
jgi:threonylcarbamoyladenosine tRNA methylthiotransferase MtaB